MTTWVWSWVLACKCKGGARVLERDRYALGDIVKCATHGPQPTTLVSGRAA